MTILSEKLAAAEYESWFIGKGHLGYQTTDHLPINRGFASHLGYLAGGEQYSWGDPYSGGGGANASNKHHDMWLDHGPAVKLVPEICYSTNFYAEQVSGHQV
jgi:hypothetical protein